VENRPSALSCLSSGRLRKRTIASAKHRIQVILYTRPSRERARTYVESLPESKSLCRAMSLLPTEGNHRHSVCQPHDSLFPHSHSKSTDWMRRRIWSVNRNILDPRRP